MSKIPTTLLEHPAQIKGEWYGIASRAPERIRDFAREWLVRLNVVTKQALQSAMQREGSDGIAHDAAWLNSHSVAGLKLIDELPAKHRAELRKLWALAFHAGARHESITVNLRYLPDVQAVHRRRTDYPAKARAAKKPKITVDKYKTCAARARSRKELFSFLGVSGPTVLAFEDKHPSLRGKK